MQSDIADIEAIGRLNARIDRLPGWSLPWLVFAGIAVAYFFAFYDISVIGFVLPVVSEQWHVSGVLLSLPITLNLIGYVVGALVVGHISDAHGRRAGFLTTTGCLTVGAALAAVSWDIWSLTVFRFITGVGTGAMLAISASLLSELSPAAKRGFYVVANYWFGALALGAAAPLISLAILPTGPAAWRVVLALGAVAAVGLLLGSRRLLPESPRWLAVHERLPEAEALVERMEATALRRHRLDALPEPAPPVGETAVRGVPLQELFRRPYVGRLIFLTCFWFFGYLSSYTYYGLAPTLLAARSISVHDSALTVALGYLAYPVGAAIAVLLVSRAERKFQVALAGIGSGVFFILSGIFDAYLVIALMFFCAQLLVTVASPQYALTAELFPTRARTQGFAVADGLGHIGGAVGPIIATLIVGVAGGASGFFFIGASPILANLILLVFAPRIGRKPLPELAS